MFAAEVVVAIVIVVAIVVVVAHAQHLPTAACLLQHALEARDHMRWRPRAYEAIPVLASDWIGVFTSSITVVL
jgi:hypothetical protein